MKQTYVILLIALLSSPLFHAIAGQQKRTLTIEQRIAHLEKGWNSKDAVLFASPFTETGNLIAPNGQMVKGRWNIASTQHRLFEGLYKTSGIEITVESSVELTQGIVLVHARSAHKRLVDGQVQLTQSRLVMVFSNRHNSWEIESLQITPISS